MISGNRRIDIHTETILRTKKSSLDSKSVYKASPILLILVAREFKGISFKRSIALTSCGLNFGPLLYLRFYVYTCFCLQSSSTATTATDSTIVRRPGSHDNTAVENGRHKLDEDEELSMSQLGDLK